jgi:hypothetical protein
MVIKNPGACKIREAAAEHGASEAEKWLCSRDER